ncbi:MAG: hypothetical protein HY518_00880 [Candidatus Aenigmarchaeota archaeon]|nr:hypothetical protein [Candidatus Aenigmarchaeota archaeon]
MISIPDNRIVLAARDAMERLINNLDRVKGRLDPDSSYAICPKNHPALIGKGDLALVFELGGHGTAEQRIGLVGKIVYYYERPTYPNNYILEGMYVGSAPYTIQCTAETLRNMGFDNIPYHEEVSFSPKKNMFPLFYHLASDLRDGGTYEVYDFDKLPPSGLKNIKEISGQAEETVRIIQSEIASGRYVLNVDYHGTRDSPEEAIRRMLFVRTMKGSDTGEIVFGDLDHLTLSPRIKIENLWTPEEGL